MDVWAWICELPNSSQWTESSDSSLVFELASSGPTQPNESSSSSTRSIQLRAERITSTSDPGADDSQLVTFTVCLEGFIHVSDSNILWTSDTCQLSSEKPFLPLVLQLLQETISRSPTAHDSSSGTCPRSRLPKLKPDVVSWIMDSHSPESFASFFGLVLLTRLFWLCACHAPAEVGSLFFRSLLAPSLESGLASSPALRTFLATVGVDAELRFVRAVGYMLTKWCISKETEAGLGLLQALSISPPPRKSLGFSYATEAHGFWILKGYAPVSGTRLTRGRSNSAEKASQFPSSFGNTTNDLVLKYALAHQQLEAVIQLEYTVGFYEGLIQVNARVDNLRLHVAKLGYGKGDGGDHDEEAEVFGEERYFPSRVRIWVGPEVGANYVGGLSLGRSTGSGESREVETQRVVKGSFSGKSNAGRVVKAKARTSTRTKRRSWRWDQDAEGNAAVFDAVLCDRATGREAAAAEAGEGFRERYGGAERVFTKSGGVVLAGDEYGEGVGWRLSKEMEGSVLKWRIGGKVWLSYCPNVIKSSSFCETRCVEWCDEVDLPLIPAKVLTF